MHIDTGIEFYNKLHQCLVQLYCLKKNATRGKAWSIKRILGNSVKDLF